MAEKRPPQGLFIGTVLLLISNIFVKGLGFFYRVVLVRLVGAEGMGLIEMAGPLFSFLLVLAGCGVQPALSQLIAGRGRARQDEYFRSARRLLLLSGSIITLAGLLFAPLLAEHISADPRVKPCLLALLPAVFIISLASAWRGYAQGRRRVSVIGMSQNVEQVVRVALGILLINWLLSMSLPVDKVAVGASIATVGGELAGFVYLLLRLRQTETRRAAPSGDFFRDSRDLLSFGLPTTAGRLVATGMMMGQALLIPLCLHNMGYSVEQATELYGRFSGVAMSLLHLPGVFTAALSVSVLPAVAESVSAEHRQLLHRRVQNSLRATVAFTLPGMALLFMLAQPLCEGLFNDGEAAVLLRLLAPAGIFLYMQATLASVLQGLGAARRLLLNTIVSGVVLLSGVLALTPRFGMTGAALAVDISWLCGFLLNAWGCFCLAGLRLDWGLVLLTPTVSGLLALAGCNWCQTAGLLPYAQTTAASLLNGAALTAFYALILFCACAVLAQSRKRRSRS